MEMDKSLILTHLQILAEAWHSVTPVLDMMSATLLDFTPAPAMIIIRPQAAVVNCLRVSQPSRAVGLPPLYKVNIHVYVDKQ